MGGSTEHRVARSSPPAAEIRCPPGLIESEAQAVFGAAIRMGRGRWNRPLPVSKSASAANDLDLISHLKAIPDQRLRRGIRFPAWSLLRVGVLDIQSGCQSLRDLKRFAIRHHRVPTKALVLDLKRPPSDSSCRSFVPQVDMAALCAAIRDWTIAQLPDGATELDRLVCDGKTLRGSIESTAGPGGTVFRLLQEQGADVLLTVKANQKTLHRQFEPPCQFCIRG
jgi:DDE_Tnp_1-associated